MSTRVFVSLLTTAFLLASTQLVAGVSAEEAARLGADLTGVGAEVKASADGMIPAYTGGLPQTGAPAGVYPDNAKIRDEAPLFTIRGANAAKYAEQLTVGHRELLKRFPDTYEMRVYPSHRPVSFPTHILEATKRNASAVTLDGTDTVRGAVHGFPFPIPKSGAEPIWNHKVRWRGHYLRRFNNQMIVQRNGQYLLTKLIEDIKWDYTNPKHDGRGENVLFRYRSQTLSPPRLAGDLLLVLETSDQKRTPRMAWRYNPGIKRINRAPEAAYDTPTVSSDGNQFYDQIDMFNGALDRYDWKLVGKKEMYIPYNSYRAASPKTRYADMARPSHFNQELGRYEKHRVWVAEATLRAGTRHTCAKRRFYIDEDSWAISGIDCYDERGNLYKFSEAHQAFFANAQAVGGLPEIIYDFNSGRYFLTALANEDKSNDWSVHYEDSFFDSAALRRASR
jgi:hypothetical protein